MSNDASKVLRFVDLGRQSYRPVWALQRRLQQQRIAGEIPDTLLFVEHNPVYTIGKNGTDLHVIASESYLKQRGIEVVAVDRGGDVTYHGPGQLVGYPIFNLNQHHKSVSGYMRQLEDVFIQALSRKWGIESQRKDGYTGAWIGNEKIVAMGVRISRWVTMHGFAMNVKPELEHFQGIIPCGIFEYGVTSLQEQLNADIPMSQVKDVILDAFKTVFSFSEVQVETSIAEMLEMAGDDSPVA